MPFTLAHLSDLHVTPVALRHLTSASPRQALGWLKWVTRRRKEYRPEVLAALVDDLQTTAPDHVVVTGDLTNLGLAPEIRAAVPWLQRLGGPRHVSVVPGNHDAYAPTSSAVWACWQEYFRSDEALPFAVPDTDAHDPFPSVRLRGPLALLGVNSAHPTDFFLANGAAGQHQLERLERLLQALTATHFFRVVLIHHPPLTEGLAPRRQLADAAALQAVLRRAGADLVLHGHMHQTARRGLPGPHGTIPVIGVRSSTANGYRPHRSAHYHLYRIEQSSGGNGHGRFRITVRTRRYDPASGRFTEGKERQVTPDRLA